MTDRIAPVPPPEGAPAPPEPDEPIPPSSPARRLLVQLFVVPFFVVAVGVGVFWLFGTVAVDRKDAAQLLLDVKTGSRNQRWQAAFELTRRLPPVSDPAARAAFSEEAVKVFQGAQNDEPRVRRYLALLLGRLGDPGAVGVLQAALSDADAETRLYALWSLALIGSPSSAPKVRPFLEAEDPGLRKTAAYAAGRMEDGEAVPTLKRLLQDPVTDVRWNAALALATLEDPAGRDVLVSMTDRKALAAHPGLTGDQQDEAVLNGLRGLVLLKDPEAAAIGERLKASDPSARVRREAPGIVHELKP